MTPLLPWVPDGNFDDLFADLTPSPPLAPVGTDPRLLELSRYPHETYRVLNFGISSDGDIESDREPAPVDEADVIGSRVTATDLHTVIVDLDVPARLVPSTTPGHSHLYVDVPVSFPGLLDILRTLARYGIVEGGYAHVTEERGEAFARLPWVRKAA